MKALRSEALHTMCWARGSLGQSASWCSSGRAGSSRSVGCSCSMAATTSRASLRRSSWQGRAGRDRRLPVARGEQPACLRQRAAEVCRICYPALPGSSGQGVRCGTAPEEGSPGIFGKKRRTVPYRQHKKCLGAGGRETRRALARHRNRERFMPPKPGRFWSFRIPAICLELIVTDRAYLTPLRLRNTGTPLPFPVHH